MQSVPTSKHVGAIHESPLQTGEFLLLLSHATGKSKEWLVAHPEFKLNLFQRIKLWRAGRLRRKGVPFAYITKHKEFFGLDFYVDNRVLVPRPETEVLVEAVLKTIKNLQQQNVSRSDETITLIDVGTGSGCVPIAILKTLSCHPERSEGSKGLKCVDSSVVSLPQNEKLKILASDISPQAIKVAKRNAQTHQAAIEFVAGNLLEPIIKNLPFPLPLNVLITANLPYGWSAWKNNSSSETIGLKFEPAKALFTGENGLQIIRELLEQIAALSEANPHSNFTVFLEFDPRQTELLKKLILEKLSNSQTEIIKDLAGHDRVALVTI
jgi:release factor glutamine methyltransferase